MKLLDNNETNFFKYSRFAMILCGTWPLKIANPFLNFLYKTHRVFMRIEVIISLLLLGPITVPLAYSFDKDLFVETLSYEIQYITLLLKVWLYESKSAKELLRKSLEIEVKLEGEILEKQRKINTKLSLIYTFMICSAFVMFCQALVYQTEADWMELKKNLTINNYSNPDEFKRQPIVYTLPFMSGNYFYVGMSSQFIGVMFVILYSIATQSMFFAYVTFIIAQIKSLKIALRHSEDVDETIRRHQELVNFVRTLDGILKYAILFDFFFYSLQIAGTVTKILAEIQDNDYSSALFHINYLCFNYLGLHFNYTTANEIIFESSTLSMSLYHSNWFEQDQEAKRKYIFMMMRLREPLCLHIGPLYSMSNELLFLIIKASYSYVTLLSKSST